MSNYPDNFRGLPGEGEPEYNERLRYALIARKEAKMLCHEFVCLSHRYLDADEAQSVVDYLSDMMGDTFDANVKRAAEEFRMQTGYGPNV